jgi:hypothetical protein
VAFASSSAIKKFGQYKTQPTSNAPFTKAGNIHPNIILCPDGDRFLWFLSHFFSILIHIQNVNAKLFILLTLLNIKQAVG